MAIVLAHDTVDSIDNMPWQLTEYWRRAAIATGPNNYWLVVGDGEIPELSHLASLGLCCSPDHVIRLRIHDTTSSRSVSIDCNDHLQILRESYIEFFSGRTMRLREALQWLDVPVQLPSPKVCRQANSKDVFQQGMGECYIRNGVGFKCVGQGIKGLRVPVGGVASPAYVRPLVRHLLKLGRFDKVRIKPTAQASSLGQFNVISDRDPRLRHLSDELFVVQEYFKHDLDVSTPFVIYPGGTYEILGLFGQHILSDGDETDFAGSFTLPKRLPAKLYKQVMCATEKAIGLLKNTGFFGRGGADHMINTAEGTVATCEVDGRATATYYPVTACYFLYGKVAAFDNRNMAIPEDITYPEILQAFADQLLTVQNRLGLVPYNFLPQCGTCYFATFGPDHDSMARVRDAVYERHAELGW